MQQQYFLRCIASECRLILTRSIVVLALAVAGSVHLESGVGRKVLELGG